MRRLALFLLLAAMLLEAGVDRAQEVIDRIVARVENDVILLSDIHQLAEYQVFVDGKAESDEPILERLIDQWTVRTEATAARFPQPSDQIDDNAIADFYKNRVVPRAESRGQTPPTLEAAHDFIQEALVQRAINEQADTWLKESRSRVRVENLLNENTK